MLTRGKHRYFVCIFKGTSKGLLAHEFKHAFCRRLGGPVEKSASRREVHQAGFSNGPITFLVTTVITYTVTGTPHGLPPVHRAGSSSGCRTAFIHAALMPLRRRAFPAAPDFPRVIGRFHSSRSAGGSLLCRHRRLLFARARGRHDFFPRSGNWPRFAACEKECHYTARRLPARFSSRWLHSSIRREPLSGNFYIPLRHFGSGAGRPRSSALGPRRLPADDTGTWP